MSWLLSLVIMLIYVFVYQVTDIQTGLVFWYGGVLLSLIFLAFSSVGFYLLGTKKGTILYLLITAISGASYSMSLMFGLDIASVLSLGIPLLMIIGTIVSIGLVVLSYMACVKIYTRKHS